MNIALGGVGFGAVCGGLVLLTTFIAALAALIHQLIILAAIIFGGWIAVQVFSTNGHVPRPPWRSSIQPPAERPTAERRPMVVLAAYPSGTHRAARLPFIRHGQPLPRKSPCSRSASFASRPTP